MDITFLRLRRLGKGSTSGIRASLAHMSPAVRSVTVRNFVPRDRYRSARGALLVRWGCTSSLEELGILPPSMVLNSAASISWCANKRDSRLDMQTAGVPVPQTWDSFDSYQNDPIYVGPVVFRKARHAQGRELYVHNGDDGLYERCRAAGEGNYYLSALINKVAEYRVFVIQGRVAWVARKTPGDPLAVAWNVAQGGRFDNVRWGEWPLPVAEAALAAARVSGTDFCGVDVMVDASDAPYVLEVNSAPSQTSPYRQECVAKVLHYMAVRGSKSPFPYVERVGSYKDCIHPALRSGGSREQA